MQVEGTDTMHTMLGWCAKLLLISVVWFWFRKCSGSTKENFF